MEIYLRCNNSSKCANHKHGPENQFWHRRPESIFIVLRMTNQVCCLAQVLKNQAGKSDQGEADLQIDESEWKLKGLLGKGVMEETYIDHPSIRNLIHYSDLTMSV